MLTDEERRLRKKAADAAYRLRPENLEKERARGRRRIAADPEGHNAKSRAWRKAHPEKGRAAKAAWQARNADHVRSQAKEYRDRTREARNTYNTKWRTENAERHRATCLARNRANAGTVNARTARRNAAKLRATPPWANLEKITEIYKEAARLTRETGERWEVDHIVPLQSRVVCGLHCEANLRVVLRSENRKKGNRFDPNSHTL